MKTKKTLLGILTLTAALAMQVHGQTFLTNGLVAHYPFNGNANDMSGNGHNGFAEHTFSTTNQFGQTNSALGFSGNSWVYVPYSPSLFSSNYTVSIMFYSRTNFDRCCILRAGNASTDNWRGYTISCVGDEQHFGFWDVNGIPFSGGQCGTPISDWQQNRWYNLTFTRTGSLAQLYRDGVLIATATTPNNEPSYAPPLVAPLYIGSTSHDPETSDPTMTPWNFFTGSISDVRFYNRSLSSAEVGQLYAYESSPEPIPPTVTLLKTVIPSFSNLTVGTRYQLQVSTDLATWTDYGWAFTAASTSMVYSQYWEVTDWNNYFFRLQVAP